MDRRKFIALSSLTAAGLPILNPKLAENKTMKKILSRDKGLYEIFKEPVSIYQPFVRWWWNGDKLKQEEYDISRVVKRGKNNIQIKVTSTLGNYMKSLKDNEVAQNWTGHQPLNSMGMLGPVR